MENADTSTAAVPERKPWQFQPGKSGNPGGVRKTDALKTLCRSHTAVAIKALVAIVNSRTAAAAARVAAAQALLDRGWGKPVQTIEADIEHRYVALMPPRFETVDEWLKTFEQQRIQ